MNKKTETLKFRPYARLLTMLGEQLIKNERIALIELVKNSYDADATWVKITFENFDQNFGINSDSKIVIEDNGTGMGSEIIKNHWVNPATPEKRKRKAQKPKTRLGRILQGEKGIGRFSMLKLGRKVDLYTRQEGEKQEYHVSFDFSMFDEDFDQVDPQGSTHEDSLFLDELNVEFNSGAPSKIDDSEISLGLYKRNRSNHGTRIEITGLKGSWSSKKVTDCYTDLARLRGIFTDDDRDEGHDSFDVVIHINDKYKAYSDDYAEKLKLLLDERAVLKVTNGYFDQIKMQITFDLEGYPSAVKRVIRLDDPLLNGLTVFWKHFHEGPKPKIVEPVFSKRKPECGSFKFQFYIFDFTSNAPLKYKLDSNDKNLIKPHRIYLYRDGIRVFPYGDEEDDWLFIDQYRGTVSAGDIVSNNQIVGKIDISHEHNRDLRDKTNREGLVEVGNAALDFVGILKGIIGYLSAHDFKRYKTDLKDKNAVDIFQTKVVQSEFDFIASALADGKTGVAKKHLVALQKVYDTERNYLVQRAETTEDLAGVGLSVESASHDILAMLHKALRRLDDVIRQFEYPDIDKEALNSELQTVRGMLSFVNDQMRDVQLLFRSSKQRRKNIRVEHVVEKVERIYGRIFHDAGMDFEVRKVGAPLIAKTTDAVLLQVLINLFDNAVYWLSVSGQKDKKILLTLDGSAGELICSDNGSGISKDDIPYIFQPFYSGKGEEGRGLGLYIARQLLERHEYSIDYADLKKPEYLSGANFIVSFIRGNTQ